MHEAEIRAALRELPLSGLRVFASLGSTNDEALAWAAGGAGDLSLVIADEQTAGRGRSSRHWYTPPGAALAFSLILRPTALEAAQATRFSGLGALAVADCVSGMGLRPAIKWPNDVLVNGRKVAGILVEAVWTGMRPEAAVLGIGMNVLSGSAPAAGGLSYPATTVEAEMHRLPDRLELLRATLSAILRWRPRISSEEFIATWEDRLAFRGEPVSISREGQPDLNGTLVGLDADGSLRLRTEHEMVRVEIGDLHLRRSSDRIA